MPRRAITISQKVSLRAYHKSNLSLDHQALREWFRQQYHQEISQSSVSEILSARYQHLDHLTERQPFQNAKRRSAERWPILEAALQEWLLGLSDQTPIPTDLLREKARWFFENLPQYRGMSLPKFSNSWIEGFRARHQTASSHTTSCVLVNINQPVNQIKQLVSAYQPQDQYFCAETTLFWKMLPESALSGVPFYRLKRERTWLSALLCANMTGSDHLPPWFIGRNQSPRAFRSTPVSVEAMGMVWRNNSFARMTCTIFEEFLHWFDARMQGRKALLLLDDVSASRVRISGLQSPSFQVSRMLELQNVLVVWLPISCMGAYHCLRQDITGIWKTYYRRYWIKHVCHQLSVHRDPLTTMNVLEAVRWACRAWHADMSSQHIRDCFKRSGLGHTLISTDNQSHKEEEEEEDDHDHDHQEINFEEAKLELRLDLERLERMSFIHEAMDVVTFVNPPFESPEKEVESEIEEEQMHTQANSVDVPEGDTDEEVEQISRITRDQALDAVSCLGVSKSSPTMELRHL